MTLPLPRGPISRAVVAALSRDDPSLLPPPDALGPVPDPLADDDLQLALWVSYELHYRGFPEVPDRWEWQPELIAVRNRAERLLLQALRRDLPVRAAAGPVAGQLRALVDADDGPSLSRFVQRHASREQFREFVAHRSIYQLKEADPYSWGIPRLAGPAKTALVDVQADEYGAGNPAGMHSELYRRLMRHLGLDDGYARYVDAVPGVALAISNVMSLFGLHRGLRGALAGHLAAYEMTSSAPCRRYAHGLRRLGAPDAACAFYDVHVTADALHEQVAAHDLCDGLVRVEPQLADDVLFGAAACLHAERRFAEHLLGCWAARRSSLRNPSLLGAGPDGQSAVAG